MKSGNGAILPGCEAIKVLHKKKEGKDRKIACGVAFEFEYKGTKDVCVVESKVTIVACGALSTPALLKRSGLRNQNIGKNLHLHPVVMAWGYFPDAPESEVWPEAYKKSYEGGIMTAMSTVVAEFEQSGYGAVIQTPSLHPGMFSIVTPWTSGIDIRDRMRKFSRTAHIFALARDQGSGTVKAPDRISYKPAGVDEENLKKGIEVGLKRGKFDYVSPIGASSRKTGIAGAKKKEGDAHTVTSTPAWPKPPQTPHGTHQYAQHHPSFSARAKVSSDTALTQPRAPTSLQGEALRNPAPTQPHPANNAHLGANTAGTFRQGRHRSSPRSR